MSYTEPVKPTQVAGIAALSIAALGVLVAIIIGLIVTFGAVGRYNARANANNHVKVSTVEIQNQEQLIQVEKNKAEIRRQEAIGIRESQEEIAKTLTPLYVQFEMTQVLMEIAHSGNNNSVVYLPVGPSGIPIVDDVSVDKVGQTP